MRILFTTLLTFTISLLSFGQEQDSIPDLNYTFDFDQTSSPLFLSPDVTREVIYDADLGQYIILERIGNYYIKPPIYMSPKEYESYSNNRAMLDYYKQKLAALDGGPENSEARRNLLPTYYVNSDFFESIFGGNEIEVDLQGSLNVRLGLLYQRIEDPNISERNRGNLNFDFDQQINASVVAKIGERLNVSLNYDTNATFDFQNLVRIEYTPTEDDILRNLEIGNINMPVQNTLIPGAQSLFGVKAGLQFGKTRITGVLSQQNSETQRISTAGGGSLDEFELKATDYDVNRHFFLSQFFRNQFNQALSNYPLINSGVQITRVEVWITNRQSVTENIRNVVGFTDLGESGLSKEGSSNITNPLVQEQSPGPNGASDNAANNLSSLLVTDGPIRTIGGIPTAVAPFSMNQGKDYSIIENARRLNESEYDFDPQLGYISLSRRLDDGEALAVAFQYTDQTGAVFQVGEFSTDGIATPKNLVLKLLRSELLYTADPIWKLMMKNIYSIGAFGVDQEGFRLELLYRDDKTGVPINRLQNAKTDGVSDRTLMNLLRVDRLDQNGFVVQDGDGIFDFVPNVTIQTERGYFMFPQTDPFGFDLGEVLDETDEVYVFNELYEETKLDASNNYQTKDKYLIKGYFKSASGGGISLGASNVPRGSVVVTAGGRQLVEGVDYVVDYQMGEVQIINPSVEASDTPIEVSLENNNLFNQQNKSFVGLDIQHQFSDNFALGATVLSVNEKPLTQKVGVGNETVNNTVFGLNTNYATEVPLFTNLVNKLPFVDTEVRSNFSVRADFAFLKPGASKGVGLNGEPTAYIDDFEGAQIPINVGIANQWYTASTPQGDFGGDLTDDIRYNFKRARLAWYTVDQLFYGGSSLRPSNITNEEISRAEVRRVNNQELFPNQELDVTVTNNVRTFDLAYYPQERGAYNYDEDVDNQGRLNNPEDRWGGIMRPLTTNDFDQANVSYIQFWVQDPYTQYSITTEEGLPENIDPQALANQVGSLYINLGNISEDILKDNRKSFENGLPETAVDDQVDFTNLGRVPARQVALYTFDEDNTTRLNQDVGIDGLNDEGEQLLFGANSLFGEDVSSDNYQFYRGSDLDAQGATLLQRYRYFNNTEGNSPTLSMSDESYSTSATNLPDIEDINQDNTMNAIESYYEYKVSFNKSDLVIGRNNVVDEKEVDVDLPNGQTKTFRWVQIRIPIRDPDQVVGNIQDFHSIRFMRMYMTDFRMPVVLRLANLELVRGDWRRYLKTTDQDPQEDLSPEEQRKFSEGVVNLEENDTRVPIPYVMPPGIQRESLQGSVYVLQQNEQSVSLKVEDLRPGETRALYKNISLDARMYDAMDMFVHAEMSEGAIRVPDGDLVAVVRIGSDLTDNYYQIERPLQITDYGASTAEEIWPEFNNLDVLLQDLSNLKLERFQVLGSDSNELYPVYDPNEAAEFRIRVKGNPNLANIQTVMLGLKNRSSQSVSAELWFDELRLSGFNNDGGWAGIVTADANFADFADFSLTAGMQTTGFGSVEQSLTERSLEDVKQYDFVSRFNLGMLMPKKWSIRIPFNYGISEEVRDPKYDQQYQDVLFSDAVDINPNSINSRAQTKRKNISFINVRKDRPEESKKPERFYDVENLMFSYAFSEVSYEDYNIERDLNQNVRTSANYNYSKTPEFVSPFASSNALNSSYLAFLRDFNFNPWPSNVSVNSNIIRNYTSQLSRNLVPDLPAMPTLTQHRFMFNWDYNIAYDLSKSLSVNFKAANNHINDQLTGREDVDIFDEFFVAGRPDQYRQTLNATYQLPFEKLPYLDFVTGAYSYTADFDWQASSQSYVAQIGNTIQNANTHNISGDLNFSTLYQNIGLERLFTKSNKPKESKSDQAAPRRRRGGNQKAAKPEGVASFAYDLLTMVKRAKVSYSENNGSYLEGYIPTVGFLGTTTYNNGYAPSLGFVFGSQQDILNQAVQEQWIVSRGLDDPYYNRSYNQTHYEKLDLNASIKPVKNLDIELFANRIFTKNTSRQVDVVDGVLNPDIPINQLGNFSISYAMLKSRSRTPEALFQTFIENREIVAQRLSEESGLPIDGYGLESQQVMLPAFVAAYGGGNAKDVSTDAFRGTPIPNWKITFRGLMDINWFKDNFSNFTLTHSYQSFYTISNYSANLLYDPNDPLKLDNSGNYIDPLNYTNLSLIEEFSPLIKLDMRMKNSLSFKGEVHTDRMFTMNFANQTATEVLGQEYVFGMGYRVKDLGFTTKVSGRSRRLVGDLNLRLDLSFRNNITRIRVVGSENNQITGGQNLFSFKFAADYALTRNIQASFYFDQDSSRYALSTTYPRKSINSGISILYNLGN